MKRRIQTILGFILLSIVVIGQTPYYFYNYQGEKVYLSLNTKYAFLSTQKSQLIKNIDLQNFTISELRSDGTDRKQFQSQKGIRRYHTAITFNEKMSDEQYLNLLSDIKYQNPEVIVSPFFKVDDDDIVGLSHFFYVKLKNEEDTILLREMSEKTNCIIIEQDPFMPLWYVLSITEESKNNAMENANVFYETGLFHTAEPDLMINNLINCSNDQYFNHQWGVKNL